MGTPKRQLPMYVDKWIVTVREGKDLTRGDGRDSFFSKMSPVCELTLGDQGPFSTSVKPNTCQPQWDYSVEFEARRRTSGAMLSSMRRSTNKKRHAKGGLSAAAADRANGSSNADGDGGDNDEDRKGLLLPPEGPKLSVVCYSRSPRKSGSSGGGREASGDGREAERRKGRVEVGRGEVTLSTDGGGGGGGSLDKNWIHLVRKDASGSQVPAGSVTLEYMFVPGIPRPAVDETKEESSSSSSERSCGDSGHGQAAEGDTGDVGIGDAVPLCRAEDDGPEKPARKLTLLLVVAVMMAAVLTVRLRGVYSTGVLELSPIPVPFKLTVGKHKGSSTHHIRLHEDGNVVVATGPKPPPLTPMVTTGITTTATLWESGPLRSSQNWKNKSNGGGGGGGGDGVKDRCKRCQLKVAKDGTMALARGREELAVFSPPRARAFFDVVAPPRGGDDAGDRKNNDNNKR